MWTVREIMQTPVVTVTPQMPIRELVQVFAKARISGAPVVGPAGEILGVVSTTDILALAAYGAESRRRGAWEDEGAADEESALYFRAPDLPLEFDADAGSGAVAEYVVEDIMTPAAYSVRSSDSIAELARFLLRGRIHRALVVDDGKLTGIATTFDVLQAVVGAEPELSGSELQMAES